MFSLDKHESAISSVNLRREKHGKEGKLAVDIAIALNSGNAILDGLGEGLRESFFRKLKKGEQQDAFENSDGLAAVKHPGLKEIKLQFKASGYELHIHGMIDGDTVEPLALSDVEVKDVTFDPIEGGSVALHFKGGVRVSADELAELGELYERQNVRVSLIPADQQK